VGVQNTRKGIGKIPSVGRVVQARSIQKELEKLKPKIILTENVSTDLLAGSMYKRRHPEVKLIGIVADPKVYELKNAPLFDKLLTYRALDRADLLMTVSNWMRDLMPHVFKYKTHIFYPEIANLRKHLAKKSEFSKNFVFVGRLDDYKGVDILYETFVRQRVLWRDSILYVAGDGKYKSMFRGGNLKNIKYLGKTRDSLFMADLGAFYLAPARCEPSGVAVSEAMAQGLVPIVSEGVGYKELVAKVDSRLVVDNIDDAISIINKLFNNKREWQRLSNKCKDVAKTLTRANSVRMFRDALDAIDIVYKW
jgi:glycosyltransferase involved in cell wall biosynthesis